MTAHAHVDEPRRRGPLPLRAARALEQAEVLDPLVQRVREALAPVLRVRAVRSVLHGEPLGHAAHPLLTDVPMGLWAAATVLDVAGPPGSDAAADRLLGLGVLAAAPTAAAGWADWAVSGRRARRVGVVHAAANGAAAGLYAASWLARRAGRRRLGVAVSLAAGGLLGVGGYLGGHLAFAQQTPPPEAAAPGDGDAVRH